MVNSRRFISPTKQTRELKLRCRVYPSQGSKPAFTLVGARRDASSPNASYAFLESLFDDAALQPYIHDCLVTIQARNRLHRFRIFFKRHAHLRSNCSLRLVTNAAFQGDVVIARVAVRDELSLVNMRAGDGPLADFVMKKFVHHASAIRNRKIPCNLDFDYS